MIPPLDERTADDSRVNMNSAFEMTKADIPWSDVLLPATLAVKETSLAAFPEFW